MTILKKMSLQFLTLLISSGVAIIVNRMITADLISRYIFVQPSLLMNIGALFVQAVVVYLIVSQLITRKVNRTSMALLRVCYLFVLLCLLFLRHTGVRGYSLNPVSFIQDVVNNSHAFIVLIMNIAVFVPVGHLLRRQRPLLSTLFMLVVVLLIETIQYVCSLGFFDLGDMVLNSVGFYIGYLLFRTKTLSNKLSLSESEAGHKF